MRKATLAALAIIIIFFAIGIYLYPQMPEQMPAHWNAAGQVDGFMPKFWGLFLMPLISVGLLLLFLVIPRIDPLKGNIAKFRNYFDGFVILIMVFLFYIYFLTLIWSLNITFNMMYMIMPAIAILLFYMGILMRKVKRNWFIGIRTPWTLSSTKVWDRTNTKGSKLFMVFGVITLMAMFTGDYAIWVFLVPLLVGVAYLFAYSYFEYQKVDKK